MHIYTCIQYACYICYTHVYIHIHVWARTPPPPRWGGDVSGTEPAPLSTTAPPAPCWLRPCTTVSVLTNACCNWYVRLLYVELLYYSSQLQYLC